MDFDSTLVNAVNAETVPIGSVNQGVSLTLDGLGAAQALDFTARMGLAADIPWATDACVTHLFLQARTAPENSPDWFSSG
jgi:hypothetical protein